jgi:sulfite reductase (NADPH) hemoprotein beta-component
MNYLTDLANDEEIDTYDQSLQDFFAQRMDTDRFTATRLQWGFMGNVRKASIWCVSKSLGDG